MPCVGSTTSRAPDPILVAGVDRSQLAAVGAEVNQRHGSRVRAVHQTGKLCFRVALEGRRGRIDLVLDLDPEFPRLNLAPPQRAPAAPSPLASGLRRALRGAQLDGARLVPGERAIALAFRRGDERPTLWFEAFGRGANLYLTDIDGIVRLTPRGHVAARRGASVGSRFEPVPPRAAGAPGPRGDSAAIDEEAARRDAERRLERRRTTLLKQLRREDRRLARQLGQLEAQQERAADAAAFRRRGELLSTYFHLLEPGLERVRVPDPDHPDQEIELELDAKRSADHMVAACFRSARKLERAIVTAEERLPNVRTALAACREALQDATDATDAAALEAVAERLGLHEDRPQTGRPEPGQRDWMTFLSSEGWRILVGRNARGNDRLTLHQARPSDLFLHVRGGSGSHVIVPTPRGKTVPRDTLIEAAELACWFSDRRGAAWSEVDHALKRHVRKPRKAPPGAVIVERARTLRLRPDATRRRRLLATRRK